MLKSKSFKFFIFGLVISLLVTITFGIYRINLGCPGMFRDCYLDGAGAYWEIDYFFRFLNLLFSLFLFVYLVVYILEKILKGLVNFFSKK